MALSVKHPMRILHLSRHEEGGAARYAYTLHEGLLRRGVSSEVLTATKLQKRSPSRKIPNLLNRLQERFLREISTTVFHTAKKHQEHTLKHIVDKFDIIHIHQTTNWIGLNQLVKVIPKATPVIYTFHDLWPATGGCVIFNGCEKYLEDCQRCPVLKRPFDNFVAASQLRLKSKVCSKWNLHVVANSEWTLRKIRDAKVTSNARSISVIPPSVDFESFKPTPDARQLLGIQEDTFVLIGGAASITDKNKNIAAMLRVAAKISIGRKVKVVVFGDGELAIPPDLDVDFLGAVSDRDLLARYFSAADVLVSTSKMETYGMTLIEAMACGTPVVAYGNGAIPFVVENGESGLLVESENESDLLNKLTMLALDEPMAIRLGSQGREIVNTRNSVNRFVAAYERVYEAAIGGS